MIISGGKLCFDISKSFPILTSTDHTSEMTLMPIFVCLSNVMTRTDCLVIVKNG